MGNGLDITIILTAMVAGYLGWRLGLIRTAVSPGRGRRGRRSRLALLFPGGPVRAGKHRRPRDCGHHRLCRHRPGDIHRFGSPGLHSPAGPSLLPTWLGRRTRRSAGRRRPHAGALDGGPGVLWTLHGRRPNPGHGGVTRSGVTPGELTTRGEPGSGTSDTFRGQQHLKPGYLQNRPVRQLMLQRPKNC